MTTVEANQLLVAALVYAKLGWPVEPLHTPDDQGICDCPKREACPKPGKHPRTMHGLDDASTDEATIRRWWSMWPTANIGIHLARANLVDVAPDSIEFHGEFIARGLPATSTFRSGGGEGHQHYLYARQEECPVHRITESGQYDILSNGYAVMPPSLHPSQRRYEWLSGIPVASPSTSTPDWVVALLVGRKQRSERPSGAVFDADAPPVDLRGEGLDRWHGRVFDTNPETGKLDRSWSLWRLGTFLLDAGCTPTFIAQLLLERDQALGWDKFTDRADANHRIETIVDRVVAGQGPGRVRGKPKVEPPPGEWVTAAEIEAMQEESIGWLAYGLTGRGLLTEMDGKAKLAGKTTLLLDLVYAVVHGEEFLGLKTTYTPVLYLTEQSGPSFKRNLSRAGLLDRDDVHVLFWNRVAGHKWPSIIEAARAKAREVNAGLLIVDTLAQWSGVRGDDENKSGAALQTMEPLQIATQDGLAVIASRHDRKSGGEVGDSGRGSSAFVGAVDIVLHLTRLPASDGKERQRLLDGVSRFEETPDKLLIEFEPGQEGERSSFRAVGEQAEVKRALLSTEIVATLPTDPDLAMPGADLRELLGVRKDEMLRELWELMKAHQVVRVGEGRRGSEYRYYRRETGDDLP